MLNPRLDWRDQKVYLEDAEESGELLRVFGVQHHIAGMSYLILQNSTYVDGMSLLVPSFLEIVQAIPPEVQGGK